MSDDNIYIIPRSPDFVPDEANREGAVSFFRSFAPEADEVAALVSEQITFVDCAGNFERIGCPSCGVDIQTRVWSDWMDNDYDGKGFSLTEHTMPCCGVQHRLDDLTYDWPQGFARCRIWARNPNVGKLSDAQRTQFEQILGCPVRVIYQHI